MNGLYTSWGCRNSLPERAAEVIWSRKREREPGGRGQGRCADQYESALERETERGQDDRRIAKHRGRRER